MADIKLEYGTAITLTCDLGALATSSTLVAGRASTAVSNLTTKYTDFLLSGFVTTHATVAPTANTVIEVWVYGSINDTPRYPDGITGTDAAVTLTSANTKGSGLRLAASILTPATANINYDIAPLSVASLFGGVLPKYMGVFVVQSTGQTLHATSETHALYLTPAYATVT